MYTKLPRPIVAAYVSNKVFNNLMKQKDKKYHKIKALVQANEIAQTTLYFFSFDGVDFDHAVILGIYYNELERNWDLSYFPFPDVFYDRVNMTTRLRKIHLNSIRIKFDELQIPTINSRHHFDKWELYALLCESERLSSHLPQTKRFSSMNDLAEMLQQCSKIYIKGRTGNRGMEVMSIQMLAEDEYEYKVHRSRVVKKTIHGLDNLMEIIASFFRKRDVIIQQAIDLLCINEKIVDLRGEVQRNGINQLEVTAVAFRVGRTDSPVSTRGTSYPFRSFCRENLFFGEEQTAIFKNQVEHFLIAIYNQVEKYYGPFGEMGIDLGLDQEGKLWFIECNAKSGKVSLANTSDKETMIKAYLNPLEYAKHLYRQNSQYSHLKGKETE